MCSPSDKYASGTLKNCIFLEKKYMIFGNNIKKKNKEPEKVVIINLPKQNSVTAFLRVDIYNLQKLGSI